MEKCVFHCASTAMRLFLILPSIIIISFVISPAHTLLTCSKCDSIGFDCSRSTDTCQGDYCFHSQYYYGNELIATVQKGCVIGELSGDAGCRVNHHGNVMCFCNDGDSCNANLTELADSATETATSVLPIQTCHPKRVGELLSYTRWVKPCAANYCTYLASKIDAESTNYTWSDKECSNTNDFDFFPTFTIFNLHPGSCVWLEYGGQPEQKVCYGSDALDTSLVVGDTSTHIECHVDYFNPSLPYIKTGGSCSGEFCFISATSRGEVYRGCATVVNAEENVVASKIGYTRSYTGMEQWLCNEAYCNADLKSAEMSWPPELYLYRNISNLREFNVFYINKSSATPFFLTFLTIFAPFF